ncbi:MAG: 5'-3' exonuclease H3TH domain-containing protein, partial [Acidimicrobiales bacterium]
MTARSPLKEPGTSSPQAGPEAAPGSVGSPTPADDALYLLDGNSLVFRAFFAVPADLRTSDGVTTNAVHGFVSMLIYLLQTRRPSGIAVAWDRPEPTFRDEVVPDYKANRAELPDLLAPQFGMVREVLDALCVPCLDLAGYEADDILATLATRARDSGENVVVVTGDRDAFQLVEDPHVSVLYTRRGTSDTTLYDEKGIEDRTGVLPVDYPVLAALRGDPSDNLAGVPGVGEKTAAKLVNKYKDLDGIFAHLDEMTPSLKKNLAASEETVRRNLTVIPLVRDAPLAEQPHDLKMGGWNSTEVRAVFDKLELKTAWGRLEPMLSSGELTGDWVEQPVAAVAKVPSVDLGPVDVLRPQGDDLLEVLRQLGRTDGPVSVVPFWSGDPGRSALEGMVLTTDAEPSAHDGARRQVVWVGGPVMSDERVAAELGELLGSEGPGVVTYQAKELERSLLGLGMDMTGLRLDVGVAAYLLDPSSGRYSLESVADTYLGVAV